MAYSNDMFGLQQLMADEQAAQQQSNINNAVNLASTKGAGMMYRAGGIGDQRGQAYASLGRMLTGQEQPVDPRMARMQKLEEIRRQVPMPETAEDFKNLARLLNGAELYEEANTAMSMANEIISSTPERKILKDRNDIQRYVDDGSEVFSGVVKTPEALGLDEQVQQAVINGYIATETQKLRVENSSPLNNANRLSEEEIIAAGRANGLREYDRVENAPAAGTPSAFSERLAVWDQSSPQRREELVQAGFFDGDAMQITIENAINDNAEKAYGKTIGELTAAQDLALIDSVAPAMRTLTNTNEVFKLLDDDGVTTGIGATYITNLKRIGNQVVKLFGKDVNKDDVSKDQYLEALLGSQVFGMIKTLGIGARGLDTPAERDFLISVMTGVRTMDKEAIKRLTRLRQEIAAEAIQNYNERINNGSLDNYIMLQRNIKNDGSNASIQKLQEAKLSMLKEPPEMYKGTWDRPAEGVSPILLNGEITGYHTWDGRYYTPDNREISIDDLQRLLNPKGGE